MLLFLCTCMMKCSVSCQTNREEQSDNITFSAVGQVLDESSAFVCLLSDHLVLIGKQPIDPSSISSSVSESESKTNTCFIFKAYLLQLL